MSVVEWFLGFMVFGCLVQCVQGCDGLCFVIGVVQCCGEQVVIGECVVCDYDVDEFYVVGVLYFVCVGGDYVCVDFVVVWQFGVVEIMDYVVQCCIDDVGGLFGYVYYVEFEYFQVLFCGYWMLFERGMDVVLVFGCFGQFMYREIGGMVVYVDEVVLEEQWEGFV